MKVLVIGVGYVGLVSGACLADVGNYVTCVDIDEKKITELSEGKIPIHETGLEEIIATNLLTKRLVFTNSVERGIHGAEVIVIAVGTPQKEDGSADLAHVLAAARSIAQWIENYVVVVTKSTVPVGSCDAVRKEIDGVLAQRGCSVEFDVVSNPEFLKEGTAVADFLKPDRIIVGSDSHRAQEKMRSLYSPFNRSHDRMLFMDERSAELTKYAANAMLATKISFINEIANLSDRVGADIESVRRGIGSDPRIGYDFIYPGCGYGGSCFPKDVRALYQIGKAHQYDSRLLSAVDEVNTAQKNVLIEKILHFYGNDIQGRHFALWGLAFKPNTDDMREAPSLSIIEQLQSNGSTVSAYDPICNAHAQNLFRDNPTITFASDPYSALDDADGLIIVTEWKEFRTLDLMEAKNRMKGAVIFDGRNIYDPTVVNEAGFIYCGIGRGNRI